MWSWIDRKTVDKKINHYLSHHRPTIEDRYHTKNERSILRIDFINMKAQVLPSPVSSYNHLLNFDCTLSTYQAIEELQRQHVIHPTRYQKRATITVRSFFCYNSIQSYTFFAILSLSTPLVNREIFISPRFWIVYWITDINVVTTKYTPTPFWML